MEPDALRGVYTALRACFGPQRWWPAETPFEVMVGAILTQNTAWTNVEQALTRLRSRIPLSAQGILSLDGPSLADALRPSGYFNIKAQRLRGFCEAYVEAGGLTALAARGTPELRAWLLSIKGIGPETADDILLYAFDRPVFVVDAYTRRIFARLGMLDRGPPDSAQSGKKMGYEPIRQTFEQALGPDVELFKEYHALIVSQGKTVCRQRPLCGRCALRGDCASALASQH